MHSRFSPRRLALLCFLGAFVASGCGEAPAQRASRTDAIGEDVPQTCTSTDAHARHAAASVACVACHPCGGAIGFDAAVTYTQGTTSAGGTYSPRTATAAPSCSVGCHSPLGSPAHSVSWEAGTLACTSCHDVATLLVRKPSHPAVNPDATRAYCEGCHEMTAHTAGTVSIAGHDADWVDRTKPTFHAFTANQGLGRCQGCHLPDLSGGPTGVACTQCHNGTLAASWNCTLCHGGTDNLTGAPPKATWGNAGDPNRGGGVADPVRVGAHTTHVAPSDIAPEFGCAVCHVTPADALAPGHVDDETTAQVVFAGLAVNGVTPAPTWNRTSATCSNTYCHGATMTGGTPDWTKVGQGEAACGTCHGVPPPAPHPAVDTSAGLGPCSTCHPLTIDTAGVLTPPRDGGQHLDGTLQAMGHDQLWMDPSSASFHAYAVDRNIDGCTGCHGAQLDGGAVGISCTSCHNGTLAVSWNCVMCHGGTDNATGAPPKALWGFAGDPERGGGTADPLRVGAHSKHLGTTLMSPIACETCHVVPANVLSPAHIDGSDALATVTWGGMATFGGAQPRWDRASGTCATTYCHGNYSGTYVYGVWDWGLDELVTVYAPYVGGRATPGWADGPVTCGSCHGNPPAQTGYWHSGEHGYGDDYRQCQLCHPDATSVSGVGTAITNPAQHVNGILEVTPRWKSQCFGCH